MKHDSVVLIFSLLKSHHGGVYTGTQRIMFESFSETKMQQSPSAYQKNAYAPNTYISYVLFQYLLVCLYRHDALGEAGCSQFGTL